MLKKFLHHRSLMLCISRGGNDPPAGRLSGGPEEQFLSGTQPLPSLRQPAASTPDLNAAPALRTHLAPWDVPRCQTSVAQEIKGPVWIYWMEPYTTSPKTAQSTSVFVIKVMDEHTDCVLFNRSFVFSLICPVLSCFVLLCPICPAPILRSVKNVTMLSLSSLLSGALLSLEPGDSRGSVSSGGRSPPCCAKGWTGSDRAIQSSQWS